MASRYYPWLLIYQRAFMRSCCNFGPCSAVLSESPIDQKCYVIRHWRIAMHWYHISVSFRTKEMLLVLLRKEEPSANKNLGTCLSGFQRARTGKCDYLLLYVQHFWKQLSWLRKKRSQKVFQSITILQYVQRRFPHFHTFFYFHRYFYNFMVYDLEYIFPLNELL